MTGRERLNAILHKQPVDRLSWSTLVDGNTLSQLPESLRGGGGIDFYRHLDCDIFLLDGWNTPHYFRAPELCWPAGVEESGRQDGDCWIREWRTPHGTLTAVYEKGHPRKYPVDSLAAVRIFREMWGGARYRAHDDAPVLSALDGMIGDRGMVTRFWGPSTIPRLLENDMGTEQFYYLLADEPEEMTALIALMHAREMEAFRHLAGGPCEVITLCENTSTYYIGPDVYRRFNMPQVRDFVETIHAAGKIALIHMCGHVLDLLPDIRQTGLDGIHALTPPPTGNTPWETALDALGEDLIIFGALDPTIFCLGPVEEIGPALDRLYTPRLRRANFCLIAFADGIAVPLERFQAVQAWMDNHGRSAC